MLDEGEYSLELGRVVKAVRKEKAKIVCIQLPDGLKMKATEIAEFIEENTEAKCVIWMGSCFGACDLPLEISRLGIDLLVQFGHSAWPYNKKDIAVI